MSFRTLEVSGARAVETFTRFRSEFHNGGLYPFIIGEHDDLELLEEGKAIESMTTAKILTLAKLIRIESWIADRLETVGAIDLSFSDILDSWDDEPVGRNSNEDSGQYPSPSLHLDPETQNPKKKVYLGLADIHVSWHLPALVKYGGWNECPEAAVHCAFHKSWGERYNAEIIGMSSDRIECFVAQPPASYRDALELAFQQFAYRANSVTDQFADDYSGVGSDKLLPLARSLLYSHRWLFEWH